MRPARATIHLVSQREALRRLLSEDAAYQPLLQSWDQALQPAERDALQQYDTLLKHYIVTAPRPEQPQQAVH